MVSIPTIPDKQHIFFLFPKILIWTQSTLYVLEIDSSSSSLVLLRSINLNDPITIVHSMIWHDQHCKVALFTAFSFSTNAITHLYRVDTENGTFRIFECRNRQTSIVGALSDEQVILMSVSHASVHRLMSFWNPHTNEIKVAVAPGLRKHSLLVTDRKGASLITPRFIQEKICTFFDSNYDQKVFLLLLPPPSPLLLLLLFLVLRLVLLALGY